MEDFSIFIPKVHFELIPIKNLVSHQEYQRNLSLSHIERAAENFDIHQINPVKVSRRNGINYVFNGQHTVEIIALVSGSRDTPVWCMIYDELEYENEANIFAGDLYRMYSYYAEKNGWKIISDPFFFGRFYSAHSKEAGDN